jgi:hypothetical protein
MIKRILVLLSLCGIAFAQPALNGLGASSYVCVDRDGDGYGTGPVALGPYTNLVIDGTDNTKVTSASHSFVSSDVGRVITITGGTGFNKNWFLITSVSSGAAILFRPDGYAAAVGTVGSTGGSWVIYGCTGPDADDLDATIHTYSQASAKYSTMQKFLSHLGYTPTRIWLLDSTGSPTAVSCTPATFESGCAAAPRSAAPSSGSLAAGDLIMVRANFTGVVNAVSGTSTAPFIVMAYPGETPYLGSTGGIYGYTTYTAPNCGAATCLDLQSKSWTITDGIQTNGAISINDTGYTDNPHTFHDNILRHIYGGPAGKEGLGPHAGGANITIEDSVFAHNNYGGSEAGLYLGGVITLYSTNFIVRRNIAYNNAWDGIHWNGMGSGHLWTQNVSHSNGIGGFSFQSGLKDSTISANLAFNNISAPMLFYNYKDDNTCGAAATCNGTGPVTGNVIENNTLVSFGELFYPTDRDMGSWNSNSCLTVVNASPTPTWDMGNNTFRNNVCAIWGDLSSTYRFAPFHFQEPTAAQYLATSTFDNNLTYEYSGINSGNALIGSGKSTFGVYNPSLDVTQNAEITYSCSSAPFTTGSATNCLNGNPKFVAAQQSYFYDPSLYDLRILDTSPAFHTGTLTGKPDYDLKGRSYIGSPGPSIGAIERQLYPQGWTNLSTFSHNNGTLGTRSTSIADNIPTVCPVDGYGGSQDPNGNPYPYQAKCTFVVAYSGAVIRDKPGSEALYLPANGGHNDYGGNEVYKITVNTTTPAVSRVTNPTPLTAASFATTGPASANGAGVAPASHHTYSSLIYLPDTDRLNMFAGSPYSGNGSGCYDRWSFDPTGLSWTWHNPTSGIDMYNASCNNTLPGGGYLGANATGSAYDPVSKNVYSFVGGTLVKWVPSSNTTTYNYWGAGGGSYPSTVIDSKRRQFIQISEGYYVTSDIRLGLPGDSSATPTLRTADSSCSTLVNTHGPGIAYDTVNDRIVGYPGSGTTVYYVDLTSLTTPTCTTSTPSGSITATANANGSFGRGLSYVGGMDVYTVLPVGSDGAPHDTFVLNLNASDPADTACSISPSSAGPFTAGQVVSTSFSATGCSSSTYTATGLTGSGLSLNSSTGALTGTAVAGSYTVNVSYDTASTGAFTLTINAAPSITSSGTLTGGTQGLAYTQTLSTSGGTSPLSCAVFSGSLPTGLSFSGCTISGTPSAAGTFTFTAKATDSNSITGSASSSLSITIAATGTTGGSKSGGNGKHGGNTKH